MIRSKFILLIALFAILSCGKEESNCLDEGSKAVLLPNFDKLVLPPCWQHNALQGTDSYVGELVYEAEGINVQYDIGGEAGFYVDSLSSTKVNGQSINARFWYDKAANDMVYITFPDQGPANFITADDATFSTVLNVIKTYQAE